MLTYGTVISQFCLHYTRLAAFYQMENAVCFCSDVNGPRRELGYEYHNDEWNDPSKANLKAVLLNNGKENPSMPVAHNWHKGNAQVYGSSTNATNTLYNSHKWSMYIET